MKFKNLNKLFTPVMYYKLLKAHYYETSRTATLGFVNENICIEGEVKAHKDPCYTLISG
jgi:hypothetical protein